MITKDVKQTTNYIESSYQVFIKIFLSEVFTSLDKQTK